MKRQAFKMRLKTGCAEEYRKRHDQIDPELIKELENAGICDYSIYLDEETNTLFAYQKVKDHNRVVDLAQTTLMKKWWAMMADIMETNADHSPISIELKEVFHMD